MTPGAELILTVEAEGGRTEDNGDNNFTLDKPVETKETNKETNKAKELRETNEAKEAPRESETPAYTVFCASNRSNANHKSAASSGQLSFEEAMYQDVNFSEAVQPSIYIFCCPATNASGAVLK